MPEVPVIASVVINTTNHDTLVEFWKALLDVEVAQSFAPYFTWWQSPWVRWRLEWDHQINKHMGPDEDTVYLQCTYSAGPHKHERY